MAMAQDSSHPTGVSDDSPRGNKEVTRARDRKANAALQMKTMGANWDEIAEVLGFPTGRLALVAAEKALENQLESQDREYLRKMADRRLERVVRTIMPKATDPDHPEHLAAAGKIREFVADHRKMWGLDAPTEVAIYSPSEREIEEWVAEQAQRGAPQLEEANIFEVEWTEEDEDKEAS